MENKLVNGESLSMDKFKVPSREFGIMPFWFWNGEMDYDEMEYQLKEYYDKGIPGIFIHARFGIKDYMGYLSDDWFDRVKFTVEKAREIGLQVWVYDEYNWPSGTAGNQVMKDDPDLTERYLELVDMEIPGQFFTFMEGTDSRYNDLEQSEPVYTCAILKEDLEKNNPNFINLMPSLSFDKVITWEAPKGPWKMFHFIERKASWYIDALDEESTRRFLELTHERYKNAMDGSFEGKIGGFYTDEPAMHYFTTGRDNPIIPWSRKMFKIFRDYNGYDLKPHLPKLFYNIGDDYEKVRYDFWSTLTKQYEKAYYKQIHDWCRENDVVFTGHLLYEEWLRRHARTGGNLFNHLKHLDMVGVDHLYPRIGTREMPDEHVALKLASSAAHQFGSVRLLCESLGGSYWDVTMERMKWITDWEYVLGVNLFNPHGFHYSIEGERKRDWPPSQFYHHTWWDKYKLFNDYVARMGYILSGGRHVAKIAILYPMNSIWPNYTPQSRNRVGDVIEFDFNYLTDTLLRLHVDFDYIDEDVMKDACVKDGRLCIRDEEYSLLLLPPVTHIKESTIGTMELLVKSGGSLMADTLLPCACVEGEGWRLAERIEKLFGRNPKELRRDFDSSKNRNCSFKARKHEGGGKAVLIEGPGLFAQKPVDMLRSAVLECIQPEIEIDSDEVFYLHRVKDGKDFFFLVNPVEEGREINVTVRPSALPQLWDLEKGGTSPMDVYELRDGSVSFRLCMQPYGSALVSLAPPDEKVHVESTNINVTSVTAECVRGYGRLSKDAYAVVVKDGRKVKVSSKAAVLSKPLVFGDEWSFSTNLKNVLITGNWKAAIDEDNTGKKKGYFEKCFDDGSWMDFRMGAWEMQLPGERDEKVYPVTLWYRTVFEASYIPDDMTLMIDGFKGNSMDIYINGKHVKDKAVRSYIDAEIKELPINDYACTGTNTVAVRLSVCKKTDGILDLLRIRGTFSLEKWDGGYRIAEPGDTVKTGSWTAQGYPYFSGTGEYTQSIQIDKSYTGKVLKLNVECGTDIVEVSVNGQDAGLRLWHPYELDITPYVKEGINTFTLKVTNTLINVLEGVEQASGIFKAEIVPYDVYELKA